MSGFVSKLVLPAFCLGLFSLSGCHNWMGYPLQHPSRIPAPGTNTYQVPSSYYNQTGGAVSQVYPGTPLNPAVVPTAGAQAFSPGVAPASYTTPVGSAGGATTASTQPGFGQPAMAATNMGTVPGSGIPPGTANGIDPRAQSNLNWSN